MMDNPYPPSEPFPPQSTAPQREITLKLPDSQPFVTYLILGVTLGVFAMQWVSSQIYGQDIPALFGMKINEMIEEYGQWWRLFTPALLHQGIFHIAFNMYALFIFGRGLERNYGHVRFFLLYVISALTGNVLSFFFSPNPSLGASTAIFGLVAAEGIFVLRNRRLYGQRATGILTNIGLIVVVNLMLGLQPGIDNWGHLGGLLGGLAFALIGGPILGVQEPDYSLPVAFRQYQLGDNVPAWRGYLAAAVVGGTSLLLALIKVIT